MTSTTVSAPAIAARAGGARRRRSSSRPTSFFDKKTLSARNVNSCSAPGGARQQRRLPSALQRRGLSLPLASAVAIPDGAIVTEGLPSGYTMVRQSDINALKTGPNATAAPSSRPRLAEIIASSEEAPLGGCLPAHLSASATASASLASKTSSRAAFPRPLVVASSALSAVAFAHLSSCGFLPSTAALAASSESLSVGVTCEARGGCQRRQPAWRDACAGESRLCLHGMK
eukprot:CAMPEP_0198692574 /NCGR_PEP_ID=MMETSP1468-20131203/230628_1 /TAXON_ID=1461545 /ORGANISM="Mantoniella sp, Strain CCMP1436" /LENGTH=229 /DNA_ID=CAMNT_0044446581 /DNA_START=63 /DNA_END=749 /DNA_ORIENTATION=-